jgi:hypothetical protein
MPSKEHQQHDRLLITLTDLSLGSVLLPSFASRLGLFRLRWSPSACSDLPAYELSGNSHDELVGEVIRIEADATIQAHKSIVWLTVMIRASDGESAGVLSWARA